MRFKIQLACVPLHGGALPGVSIAGNRLVAGGATGVPIFLECDLEALAAKAEEEENKEEEEEEEEEEEGRGD